MKIDYEILSLYKGHPEKEFSSSEIISSLYPEESKKFDNILGSEQSSYENKKSSKQERAKLQRRVLHHLSSMVSKELLLVTKTGNKGKKFYGLAIREGESLIIDKFTRKLVIRKPSTPVLPIGDLEDMKFAFRVEPDSFFDKVKLSGM